MHRSAEILIIGAGVVGASIAYHLSVRGFKNIVVIDSAPSPGLGSTGKATGGFRSQFGSGINIQLSLLSKKQLSSFQEVHGIDPGYLQAGYLFLAKSETELGNLRNALALQTENGVLDSGEVTPEEIIKLNPYINSEGITGGSFCPSDGFISPLNILKGFTESAKRNGAEFFYDETLLGFEKHGDKIITAVTSNEKIAANIFINASGAWAGMVALLAGVSLPVEPLKRQVGCISGENILPANLPMTIFVEDSFHFRMRNGRLILLLPSKNLLPENFNTDLEENWLRRVITLGKQRIPVIENSYIDMVNSWAGLYEMSPDEHAILGRSVEVENFYLANGSSGHGVMHSPAVGKLLAEIISGEKTSIDVSPLRPSRFKEKKLNRSIPFF